MSFRKMCYRLFRRVFEMDMVAEFDAVQREKSSLEEQLKRGVSELALQKLVGRGVISIPTSIEDPVVGIVTRITLVGDTKVPMPVVMDYLTMAEGVPTGKIFMYSDALMKAAFNTDKLSLIVLAHSGSALDDDPGFIVNLVQTKSITPYAHAVTMLHNNGFFRMLARLANNVSPNLSMPPGWVPTVKSAFRPPSWPK